MAKLATLGALIAAVGLVTSCSGSGSSAVTTGGSPTLPRSSATAPQPRTFTSKSYGYTVTVPARWTARQAFEKWDGTSELDGTSALVDLFGQPNETKGIFAAATPWKRGLAAYRTFLITWNAHYHGDYCPAEPNTTSRVTVGGQPGVLLAYNCGILVNNVVTVHGGVGYLFAFVDQGIPAATDPTDHATFLMFLRSVQFLG